MRRSNAAQSNAVRVLRRTSLWLLAAGVIAFQASSCGFVPTPTSAPTPRGGENPSATTATRFVECRDFFAGGVAPAVPKAPLLRELCYSDFAVLHSGQTKTPVFVAQRLSRQSIQDAQGEKRTNRFFADARLPRPSALNSVTTKALAMPVATWRLLATCRTPQRWRKAFRWQTWFRRTRNRTQAPGLRLSRTRGAMRCVQRAMSLSSQAPCLSRTAHPSVPTRCAHPPMSSSWSMTPRRRRLRRIGKPMPGDARAGPPISYEELSGRIGMELLSGVALR